MNTHTFDISELQSMCTQSVLLNYNVNTADSLTLQMKPDAYAEHGFSYGDRINVKQGDRLIFSGIVSSGASCTVQAGDGESVSVSALSDYSIFERTAYCRMNDKGQVVYPHVSKNAKFTKLQNVISSCADFVQPSLQASWAVEYSSAHTVPAPEGNGITSCASLITEAMRWVPDAVMVNRYSAENGQILFTEHDKLEHLTLGKNALLTSVQLQSTPEAVPPVCALVGGDNYRVPSDGSLQQPGCFIFAVPVDRDGDNARAGASPASQKMTIKGIAVPERTVGKYCAAVYDSTAILAGSDMHKFLSYFFPAYRDILLYAGAAAPLLSVLPVESLQEDDPGTDEDSKEEPKNYSDPLVWGSGNGYDNCYIMTEGSFTASSRSSRNLKGLRWCRGSISVNLSMTADQYSKLPAAMKPGIDGLFPGRNRKKIGNTYQGVKLVNLKLDCVFINARKRIYDTATNQPCSTDAEYNAETQLTASDYRNVLDAYYTATRTVWHNGSITLLHTGELQPEQLTGRSVTIAGKRAEWESMNAIIHSVTWDYKTQLLSLSLGNSEQLDFSSMLQRKLMAKAPYRETEQQQCVPFDVADPDSQKESETEMSVSPSISASVSGSVSAKYRKPFTLYETYEASESGAETVKVWLAGGTLKRGNYVFNVPDTDVPIIQGKPASGVWRMGGGKIMLEWAYIDGSWTYSIYQ